MKRVEVRKNRVVETPWLRIDDAAAYCGLSRSAFDERAARVPHAGDERLRLYHVKVLDLWIQGDLPEAPFAPVAAATPARRRRAAAPRRPPGGMTFFDPNTGQAYPTKSTTGGVIDESNARKS